MYVFLILAESHAFNNGWLTEYKSANTLFRIEAFFIFRQCLLKRGFLLRGRQNT